MRALKSLVLLLVVAGNAWAGAPGYPEDGDSYEGGPNGQVRGDARSGGSGDRNGALPDLSEDERRFYELLSSGTGEAMEFRGVDPTEFSTLDALTALERERRRYLEERRKRLQAQRELNRITEGSVGDAAARLEEIPGVYFMRMRGTGGHREALLRVRDRRQWVEEGDLIDGTLYVERIHPTWIVVRSGDSTARLGQSTLFDIEAARSRQADDGASNAQDSSGMGFDK